MPKVTVWECPRSYMLFRTEEEYKAHLKKLARQRAAEKKMKLIQIKRDEKMDELYQCRDFTEIENWLKANWQFVANDKNVITPVSISFQNMYWSQTSSNSHSAPKGRMTNWGTGKPSAPKGYPGWTGKLFVTYDREPNLSTFDVMRHTNIYAGSGGGWKSFQASTNIWAEDFPNMVEEKDFYPHMVPQNARGDIDLSDERITQLNWLMWRNAANLQPIERVAKWLNKNCGKRQRICVGDPSTWHLFSHANEAYVFLNTKKNKDRFEKYISAYRSNWELLNTLPQISETSHRFREADKTKLGEQSYAYGCLCLDDIEFEPLGEVIKVDMYRLFTDRDDFTLFTVQANDINKPIALTPW